MDDRAAPVEISVLGPEAADDAFRSVFTPSVPQVLDAARCSLIVSTYQANRLIVVRGRGTRVNTHLRRFTTPMGIAVTPRQLAIGTKRAVWELRDQPAVAARREPPGSHDACYIPRRAHVTGDIQVHEVVYAAGELVAVNTRFSCLCTFDPDHSFVPVWRPPFVSAYSADDRCHLNGVAVRDGRVRWVTALAATDTGGGWRDRKVDGGVVVDVESNAVVATGLSMPHSPRWYGGRLWVLESGKGEVGVVDERTGSVDVVARLPGFTRGLAFAGHHAFVGLSQVRDSVFGGIPLTARLGDDRQCGVWVLDIRDGSTVGFLRFEGDVREIFDVQVVPDVRWPDVIEPDDDAVDGAFVVPDAVLAEVEKPAGQRPPEPSDDYPG